MLKNEKEKFFLSVIAILIISGLLVWQGIARVKTDIERNIGAVKNKKVSIKVYDLKKDALASEIKDYDFSKNKIEKINDYFVYADDNDDMAFTSFFTRLEDLAFQSTQKTNSLTIELYQSKIPAPKDKNKKASVQADQANDNRLLKLNFQGNFESLLNFISYLEAMPYYVYIESASVNADSGGAGTNKILNKGVLADDSINLQTVLIIKIFRKTNIL